MTQEATLDYRNPSVALDGEAEEVFYGLTVTSWAKIAIVAVLMAATFRFNLVRLWLKTNPISGQPNWRHAICVPLIGLYFLYVHRDELLEAKSEPLLWNKFTRPGRMIVALSMLAVGIPAFLIGKSPGGLLSIPNDFLTWNGGSVVGIFGMVLATYGALILAFDWGVASTLIGIRLFAYGIYPGQNDFIKDFGMVVTLFGVVTLMCGWRVMKIAWFPIVFLICAIPWPELVYSYVASPLQRLAATVAVQMLKVGGVEAFHNGTKIIINGKNNTWRTLNVAEACAGLRSLMTFISVAAAVAFLSARPLWQKIIVTVMAIPIAVFCNVMRVSGQGFLDRWNHEFSEGFAHQFAGVVMLIPGFFFILFVGWLLDQVFIEVVDDREERRKKAALVKPSKPVEWTLPGSGLVESQAAVAATAPTNAGPAVVLKTTVTAPVVVAKTPASVPATSTPPTPKPAASAVPAPAAKPAAKAVASSAAPAVKPTVKTAVSPAAAAPVAKAAAPAIAPKIALSVKPAQPSGAPSVAAPTATKPATVAKTATIAKAPAVKVASAPASPGSVAPKLAVKPVIKPAGAPVGSPVAAAIKSPGAVKPPVGWSSSVAPSPAVKAVAQSSASGPAVPSATPTVKPLQPKSPPAPEGT